MKKRNDDFLKELGGKIKNARMKSKMTIRKFGEDSGFDYSWLSRVENGQSSISILNLKKIADALKIDVKDFL